MGHIVVMGHIVRWDILLYEALLDGTYCYMSVMGHIVRWDILLYECHEI